MDENLTQETIFILLLIDKSARYDAIVHVTLNKDNILDFSKGPHVFDILHLKYLSCISVHTLIFKMVMS